MPALPVLRDQALARSVSPEKNVAVVVAGVEGGTHYSINVETVGGLVLSRAGVISFHAVPDSFPLGQEYAPPPSSFEVEWFPREGMAAIVADARYVALFDYSDGRMELRPELTHQHERIKALISETRVPGGS